MVAVSFDDRKAELLAPLRSHCSGCERCQGDYGCITEQTMSHQMRRTLLSEFPNRRDDIMGPYEREQAALQEELDPYDERSDLDWAANVSEPKYV